MNLMSRIVRRSRAGAIVSGLAFVLLGGAAFAQGYSGHDNGGSATYQGRGTNGGSQVNGEGHYGPRSKQLEGPNTGHSSNNPGVAAVPQNGNPPVTNPGSDMPGAHMNPKYGTPMGTKNPQEYPPTK